MSWREVIISGCAKLDYKMDYLVVRKATETKRIYIGEIALLLIESTSVSLTTTLLAKLIKNKVKVIFCDEKHNPSSELSPFYGSHDCSLKIRQQIAWDMDLKSLIWTEIVYEKIRNQMVFLYELGYTKQGDLLKTYIDDMKIGDESNREGHAAKVYFNTLFGKDFTRSLDNNINLALNYGYSLILASFNREIVSNGYLTEVGLFHDNIFNQFNLASDLMEPFRTIIDRKVLEFNNSELNSSKKLEIINLLNKDVSIDGKITTINNAIKVYCKSVFNALNARDISEIKFYKNEL